MKKFLSVLLPLVLCCACGCADTQENKDTRFLLDTVVTLTADCDDKTLDAAFSLCQKYERLLSRTETDSDVSRLNSSQGFCEVSEDTRKIVEKGVYYGALSDGKFDITIYPVSTLWDFNGEVIPNRDEISEALKNIDYQSVEINDNSINLNGKKIDLGGIAKGYIADRVRDYFIDSNVPEGIIDLGGNIIVFGDRDYTVGVKKPFSDGEIIAAIKLRNKSVVTAGVYERYIEQDGKIYHHILDPKTGVSCESDLYSATVISDSSLDCDALSTVCVLMGHKNAAALIENTPDTEAIFVDSKSNVYYTSGIKKQNDVFCLK